MYIINYIIVTQQIALIKNKRLNPYQKKAEQKLNKASGLFQENENLLKKKNSLLDQLNFYNASIKDQKNDKEKLIEENDKNKKEIISLNDKHKTLAIELGELRGELEKENDRLSFRTNTRNRFIKLIDEVYIYNYYRLMIKFLMYVLKI